MGSRPRVWVWPRRAWERSQGGQPAQAGLLLLAGRAHVPRHGVARRGTGRAGHCPWAHRDGQPLGRATRVGAAVRGGSLSEPSPLCSAPRVPPPGAGVPAGAGLPAPSLQRQALRPGCPPRAPQHPGRTRVRGVCAMFGTRVACVCCVRGVCMANAVYVWRVCGICVTGALQHGPLHPTAASRSQACRQHYVHLHVGWRGGLCCSPLKHPIKPQTWSPGQVVPEQLRAPSWCQCRATAMGAQQGQGHAGGGDVCQVGSCVPFPSLTPPTPPAVGAL